MRYSARKARHWISGTVFSTSIALLAPCAARAEPDLNWDCEMALQVPMEALINPVVHEIGSVRPLKDKNGSEKKGWVEKKKRPPRYPIVRKKRPPEPPRNEEQNPKQMKSQ